MKFQNIDLLRYGMSKGELTAVIRAVGIENLIDPRHPDAAMLSYLAMDTQRVEHLLDDPSLLKTPIVRNGKQATVGYCPDVWKTWE